MKLAKSVAIVSSVLLLTVVITSYFVIGAFGDTDTQSW